MQRTPWILVISTLEIRRDPVAVRVTGQDKPCIQVAAQKGLPDDMVALVTDPVIPPGKAFTVMLTLHVKGGPPTDVRTSGPLRVKVLGAGMI
ncbi:hypothetical protein D3C80_709450 [compost metagenome]